ncbi:class I SAM-dependent methyltransferase [Saccharothrix sp. ST-888]|uniref:class I SAM-dependent methyltransferase n=1 Tax=Saccharothrix sp. ST-888 TaxID=1427391 RepID=UPI000697CBB5|nr:methyltransferase domain-containing protein [Saccharothrix sp. ST-888]
MKLHNALKHSGTLWGLGAAAASAAAWSWWALDSAPYPYAQHRLLDLPLPFLGQERLDAMLELRRGDRVLEIGPGTGLQSLRVAPQLGSEGRLDIVDVQQEMLDHVMGRADRSGIGNIHPTCTDAHELPFDEARFDAAYLVTTLGEIPRPELTLRELRRVVKPDGRIVVGEFFDRHQVRRAALAHHANAAGLHISRFIGPPFAYFAQLRPCPATSAGRADHSTPPGGTAVSSHRDVRPGRPVAEIR